MSIKDSDTLENCDEICVQVDDLGLLAIKLKILSLLDQKYICCFEPGE